MQNESRHAVIKCPTDRRDPADTAMKTTMHDFAPTMRLIESVDIPSVSAILDIALAHHHVAFVSSNT